MLKSKPRSQRVVVRSNGAPKLPKFAGLLAIAGVTYLNFTLISGGKGNAKQNPGRTLEKRLMARANQLLEDSDAKAGVESVDPQPLRDMAFPIHDLALSANGGKSVAAGDGVADLEASSNSIQGNSFGTKALGSDAVAAWAAEEAGTDPVVLPAEQDSEDTPGGNNSAEKDDAAWPGERETWRDALQKAEQALSNYQRSDTGTSSGSAARDREPRPIVDRSTGRTEARVRDRVKMREFPTRIEPRIVPARDERGEDGVGGTWDEETNAQGISVALNGAPKLLPVMPTMGNPNRTDKVAFMFLTRGRLPFERAWTKFFNQDTLGRHTIFIHAPPAIRYDPKSIWYNRKLPTMSLVKVEWGEPSMVEAEKALLRYALQDPGVSKMLLLSETDIPVQGFDCVHTMVTEKPHSFLQSIPTQDRFPPKMKYYISPKMWRKGSQWFVLNRDHAQLVVDDRDFWIWFKRYCTIFSLNPCIADEHYIPTLLALRKAEGSHELIKHSLTWAEWSSGKPNPETFGKKSALKTKVTEIRRCHYNKGKKTFYPFGIREVCGEKLEDEFFSGLGNENDVGADDLDVKRPCYAFARKFSPDLASKYAAGFESVTQSLVE